MMKRACLSLALFVGLIPVVVACGDSSSNTPPNPNPPVDAGTADSEPADDGGTDCPATKSPPIEHQLPIETETWAANSVHIVKGSIRVNGTLTIEPCAEVLLDDLAYFNAWDKGKIVAAGEKRRPIHFGAVDPAKPYASIMAQAGGQLRFTYVKIDGGGAPQNAPLDNVGMIYAQGSDGTAPTQDILFVDHVTITGSKSDGVHLQDGAGFAPGSTDLTVTGSASYPITISPRAVNNVPPGKYTGNAKDEILLPGGGGSNSVSEDATLHERGVPYKVGSGASFGDLHVQKQGPPGLATLTIEPGVVIRFKKDGYFQIDSLAGDSPAKGALVAVGTADKPIVLTSESKTPVAGDWLGLEFWQIPSATNKLEYVRVEYAGGKTQQGSESCNTNDLLVPDAAIKILGKPSSVFIKNTTILNSAAHGIDRGYRADEKLDFLPTNTFNNVAVCKQTWPRDVNGACPQNPACPK